MKNQQKRNSCCRGQDFQKDLQDMSMGQNEGQGGGGGREKLKDKKEFPKHTVVHQEVCSDCLGYRQLDTWRTD